MDYETKHSVYICVICGYCERVEGPTDFYTAHGVSDDGPVWVHYCDSCSKGKTRDYVQNVQQYVPMMEQ